MLRNLLTRFITSITTRGIRNITLEVKPVLPIIIRDTRNIKLEVILVLPITKGIRNMDITKEPIIAIQVQCITDLIIRYINIMLEVILFHPTTEITRNPTTTRKRMEVVRVIAPLPRMQEFIYVMPRYIELLSNVVTILFINYLSSLGLLQNHTPQVVILTKSKRPILSRAIIHMLNQRTKGLFLVHPVLILDIMLKSHT